MNSAKSFQRIIEHFKRRQLKFQVDETRPILRATFGLKNCQFQSVAVVSDEDDLLQWITFLPVVIPTKRRAAVAEACVRASHRMKLGRFELDFANGALGFHASAPYAQGELAEVVIERLMFTSLAMVDHYFPALMRVGFGGVSPELEVGDAKQVCEAPTSKSSHETASLGSRIAFN